MASPFYEDWTFWSFVVAGIAVALSQLPPISYWLKKAKIELDVYTTLYLTHKLGNPNAQLQIGITNTGNRSVKIKEMSVVFKRIEPETVINLPAKSFFQLSTDKTAILLHSFRLAPADEWSHIVVFFQNFNRQDEKLYRDLENNMRSEISRLQTATPNTLVNVSEEFLQPYLKFYDAKFKWEPGEYTIKLKINTDPISASVERNFRFTLFETDSKILRQMTDDYKYGAGITWEIPNKFIGLVVPLHDA